ncbi:MAG: ComEC/Rec2 family competence protein [Chloroflexi bacterium]|nr:ComEC/Rec2 family competence protein [Chloroflexota bacterium]
MTIIYLAVAWFLGLWLAATAGRPGWLWGLAAAMALAATLATHRQPLQRLALACLAFFFLGGVRYVAAVPAIDDSQVAFYNGQEVTLVGLVVEEPDIRDQALYLRVAAESLVLPGGVIRPVEGLVLIQAPRRPAVPYGTRLQATGRLEQPPEAEEFDYRAHLARQGIYSFVAWPRILALAEDQGNPVRQAIYTFKGRAQAIISRLLPDPQASLLSGILLGVDSGLPPELAEQFRTTGMTHIIAISGFNITILVAALLKTSQPVVGRRWATWLALGGVALYAILVGAGPSVVRAAVMGSLYVVAHRLLGRPSFAPASLFTAGLAMTLFDPLLLWDVGFQLSFAATLGLMFYAGPLNQSARSWLQRRLPEPAAGWLMGWLSDALLVTLAAQVLTLPLMASYFGQLSLVSLAANLFILPAQPAIMAWGSLATLAGLAFPAAGQALAWVAWLFLAYTTGLVQFFAGLPGATAPVAVSPAGIVAVYAVIFSLTWLIQQRPEKRAALLAALRQDPAQRLAITGCLAAAILTLAWGRTQPDGALHVAFLDVGQGDAIFIQTPSGRQILVDGGSSARRLKEQLGRQLPFWDRHIDLLLATQPANEHVAALPDVFDRYQVGQLVTNGATTGPEAYTALLAAAVAGNTPVHHALAGEVITVGDGVRLEVLHPAGALDPANSGHNSVALRLVYGGFRLLLTGDAGTDAEQAMLQSGRPLDALVYKGGDHGAGSAPFLAAVRPQIIVISAEANSSPHPGVLQWAAGVGAVVLRTGELGTIEVVSDGQTMWWQSR